MKITKKKLQHFIHGVCFFFVGIVAVAETATCSELDSDIFSQLIEKEKIYKTYYKQENIELELCPKTDITENIMENWTADEEPVFIAESLFYLKKSEKRENEIELISRLIRSFSSMEGIEYYSHSDKKMKTLYKKSYTVNNPQEKKRIPDEIECSLDKVYYAFQEDTSFGENIYETKFLAKENTLSVVMRNEMPLKFGFITAVKKNNLVMTLSIIDKGDFFITYIMAQINFPSISLFESKVNKSFSARIDAMYNWIISNYLKTVENK